MASVNVDYYYVEILSPLEEALHNHFHLSEEFTYKAAAFVAKYGADSAELSVRDGKYIISALNFMDENAPLRGWRMNAFGHFEPKDKSVEGPSMPLLLPSIRSVWRPKHDSGVRPDARYCLLGDASFLLANPKTVDNKSRQPADTKILTRKEYLDLLASEKEYFAQNIKDLSDTMWRPSPIARGEAFQVSEEMESLNRERNNMIHERPFKHTWAGRALRRSLQSLTA